MDQFKLGEMEQKFADIIWEHEPVSSRELTELCSEAFAWKRTTTYTMLKRLCNRLIFENQKGRVVALMSKEDFSVAQGKAFLKETFKGSLPLFFSAFTSRNPLSDTEISELQKLIEAHKEDHYD